MAADMSLDNLISPCEQQCSHRIACDRARSDHDMPHSGWDWRGHGDVHEWDADGVCMIMLPLPIDPPFGRALLSEDERAQMPWSAYDEPHIDEVELP